MPADQMQHVRKMVPRNLVTERRFTQSVQQLDEEIDSDYYFSLRKGIGKWPRLALAVIIVLVLFFCWYQFSLLFFSCSKMYIIVSSRGVKACLWWSAWRQSYITANVTVYCDITGTERAIFSLPKCTNFSSEFSKNFRVMPPNTYNGEGLWGTTGFIPNHLLWNSWLHFCMMMLIFVLQWTTFWKIRLKGRDSTSIRHLVSIHNGESSHCVTVMIHSHLSADL